MNLVTPIKLGLFLLGLHLTVGCGGGAGCGDCEYDDPVSCEDNSAPTTGSQACEAVCPADECDPGCDKATESSNGACAGGSSPSCTGWGPDGEVTLFSGVYYINQGYVYNVLADVRPIWGCDGISVTYVAPGFEIDGADAGDLVYELGLRDGDVLLDVNGFSVETVSAAAYAYFVLWVINGESNYELTFMRGETPTTLEYQFFSVK